MAFLSFIYRYAMWISIPVFAVFVFLLVQCITGVIQTGRQARLLSVPLAEQQEIGIHETGRIVLAMEGPLLSRRFSGLKFILIGPDGMDVKGRKVLIRSRTTGFSKATMDLMVFEIGIPGRHIFRISGLSGKKPADAEHLMIFSRPHLGTTILYIIGIVFTSIFTIGSLVLFLLRLAKGDAI